jgi:hypothetical protein
MGEEKGRLIAIGDVHGCADELEEMLDKIAPTVDDTLIFLGDLVNRGPATARVLERVRNLANARSLLGNHELRLLRYRHQGDPAVLKDYDWETLKQIGIEDWAFLESLELTISYPEFETEFGDRHLHPGHRPGQPRRLWQAHQDRQRRQLGRTLEGPALCHLRSHPAPGHFPPPLVAVHRHRLRLWGQAHRLRRAG